MNYNIYIADPAKRKLFAETWTECVVIDSLSDADLKHTVIINNNVTVTNAKFFSEIQRLCDANNYLDALRHPAFLLFGNSYVKLHDGRDYWTYNFRPVVDFDDSTWHD